jgi:hypothetical protein
MAMSVLYPVPCDGNGDEVDSVNDLKERSTCQFPISTLGVSSTSNRLSAKLIESLPNELLTHIFGYFETPPSSTSGLLEEPIFELTSAEVSDLKAISCVSRRWRSVVLPRLFKNSRFITATISSKKKQALPVLREEIQPLLSFIRKYSLAKAVTSFVLVARDEKVSNNAAEIFELNGFASFWKALFEVVNPSELLIIAHPEALGALTSCRVWLQDRWTFDSPCHYLRLQQALPEGSFHVTQHVPIAPQPIGSTSPTLKVPMEEVDCESPETSTLFNIRPWSTLLLNEGSFFKVYSTYDFWSRQPPSVSRSYRIRVP